MKRVPSAEGNPSKVSVRNFKILAYARDLAVLNEEISVLQNAIRTTRPDRRSLEKNRLWLLRRFRSTIGTEWIVDDDVDAVEARVG